MKNNGCRTWKPRVQAGQQPRTRLCPSVKALNETEADGEPGPQRQPAPGLCRLPGRGTDTHQDPPRPEGGRLDTVGQPAEGKDSFVL